MEAYKTPCKLKLATKHRIIHRVYQKWVEIIIRHQKWENTLLEDRPIETMPHFNVAQICGITCSGSKTSAPSISQFTYLPMFGLIQNCITQSKYLIIEPADEANYCLTRATFFIIHTHKKNIAPPPFSLSLELFLVQLCKSSGCKS